VFSLCVGGAAAILLFYVLYLRFRCSQLIPEHETFKFGLGRYCNFELSIQTVNNVSAAVGVTMAISLGAVASVTLEINFEMHLFLAAMFFGSNGVYITLVTLLLLYRLYDHLCTAFDGDAPLHVLRWKLRFWCFLAVCYHVTPVVATIIVASAPDHLEAFNGAAFANMLCIAEYATVLGTLCWVGSLPDDVRRIEIHLEGARFYNKDTSALKPMLANGHGQDTSAAESLLLNMDEDVGGECYDIQEAKPTSRQLFT
jgi:hypothetical protein